MKEGWELGGRFCSPLEGRQGFGESLHCSNIREPLKLSIPNKCINTEIASPCHPQPPAVGNTSSLDSVFPRIPLEVSVASLHYNLESTICEMGNLAYPGTNFQNDRSEASSPEKPQKIFHSRAVATTGD